jgi:uncharacterized protein YqgC (DUF456 family)
VKSETYFVSFRRAAARSLRFASSIGLLLATFTSLMGQFGLLLRPMISVGITMGTCMLEEPFVLDTTARRMYRRCVLARHE